MILADGISENGDNDEFKSAWGATASSHKAAKAAKESNGYTVAKKNPFQKR